MFKNKKLKIYNKRPQQSWGLSSVLLCRRGCYHFRVDSPAPHFATEGGMVFTESESYSRVLERSQSSCRPAWVLALSVKRSLVALAAFRFMLESFWGRPLGRLLRLMVVPPMLLFTHGAFAGACCHYNTSLCKCQ